MRICFAPRRERKKWCNGLFSVIMNGQGKNSTSTTFSLLVQVFLIPIGWNDVPAPVRIQRPGVSVCVKPFEVRATNAAVLREAILVASPKTGTKR
jgi:hypothetical protein